MLRSMLSALRSKPATPTSGSAGASGIDRRTFLRGLALGGAVIAGEMWIPGAKVISIPKIPEVERYTYRTYGLATTWTRDPILQSELERIHTAYYRALVDSLQQTKENLIAGILNEAFGDDHQEVKLGEFTPTWEDFCG